MRITLLFVLAATVLATASPAPGQTLSERIDAVKRKHAERATRAEADSKLKILQALLYTELTVGFDQTPARDVFEFFKTALAINLIPRYLDDAVGYGIDPDTPITLVAEDMIALEALTLVLEQCSTLESCTWQLRGDFLEVGTKERLSVPAARETRWYPIDELVFEAPKFDDAINLRLEAAFPWYSGYNGGLLGAYPGVYGGSGGFGGAIQHSTGSGASAPGKAQRVQSVIDLITDLIEPQAWTANGGNRAAIHFRDGALIVRAPEYIQRQIAGYPNVPPPSSGLEEEPLRPAAPRPDAQHHDHDADDT